MIAARAGLLLLFAVATACGCGSHGADLAQTGVTGTSAGAGTRVADSLATHGLVTAAQASGPLTVVGSEPFWNVRVTADGILYTDPEHADGWRFPPALAVVENGARVYRSRRELPAGDTGPRSLELWIREEPCSDGMSDRQYSLSAALKLDELTLNGCARYDQAAR